MGLNGENFRVYATHVRNAMALAFNPHTYFLWAGGAGQDDLTTGHPYEYFDAINEHPAGSSWGWPACEENRVAYTRGADCSAVILPHIELPPYSTIVGATFYPLHPTGPYAFPEASRGGLFLAAHGSWHTTSSGAARVGPQVDFVPMSASGWDAATPIDWSNPSAQFTPFFSGFQIPGTARFRGRPTGVSFGPGGSLFIADDQTGNIYRIRPL
jgi:glucose/arabinose dehydrogenase